MQPTPQSWMFPTLKFCQHCAAPVVWKVPKGDDRARHYCERCHTVFYRNPKNVVGTIPVHEDRILLCKRAIEPRAGKWTLPAGFMENGESSLHGAIRETREEAGARVVIPANSLYTLFNLPRVNQVYMFFRAELASLEFSPGAESLAVDLFAERDIPWDEIAFRVVKSTLKHYWRDRKHQHFPVRMFDVHHHKDHSATTTLISHSHAPAER